MPWLMSAAIFTYSLVIYGTFLTRSGILGDFSVHSFSNSNVGLIIAIINAIVLIGGLFILMQKVQYLPKGKMYESFSDRAFLILLGSLILIFVAVIVWIGMSMPLLTAALDNPAAVDTDFYTRTTSPLAIVIALLIIIIFAKYKLKGISRGGIITHKGQTFTEDGTAKYYVYDVDGEEVRALTKLRGSGEDSAREPAILHKVTGDVYIAPSPPQNTENSELILELKKSHMGEDYSYVFTDSVIETDESGHPTLVKVTIQVTATFSTKPFIWLLWLSASAVVVGTLIAIKR